MILSVTAVAVQKLGPRIAKSALFTLPVMAPEECYSLKRYIGWIMYFPSLFVLLVMLRYMLEDIRGDAVHVCIGESPMKVF